jgi:hypothetical protein
MATTKITDLTAYTDPVSTDVLPIVDVTSDVTKKVSIANVMKNASLGTAAAPAISFDGDPNTGIYSPGADQVAVTTGGTQRLLIDSAGAVTIAGDLTVNGTTTNINTTNLVIEDKNIILGDVTTPTDVTADGGGITLKGTTDKTINWVDSTDAWTSSERFSYPLGSAAAPTLTFTGDANTGIYSPGADQVAISTNGTGRLFVASDGRVGVGGAPEANINFDVTSTGTTIIRSYATASNQAYLSAAGNNATVGTSSFDIIQDGTSVAYLFQRANQSLIFGTNNTERMRLDSSGRLGLGTSGPQAELNVAKVGGASTVYIESDAGNNATTSILRFGGASGRSASIQGFRGASSNIHSLDFYTYNSADVFGMRLTSTGLGIGTSSPGATLAVDSSSTALMSTYNSTNANGGYIELRSSGTVYGDIGTAAQLVTSGSASDFCLNGRGSRGLVLGTNNASRLYINSSGNVGIGTTSPSHLLDIANAASFTGLRLIRTNNNNSLLFTVNSSDTIINAAGSGTAALTFQTESTERARIDSSGRVGIGTTSPGHALHVSNGNDSASGEFVGITIGGTNSGNARTGSIIKDTTTFDLIYRNQNFSSALGAHVFRNGPSEHARIDSSGRLLVGTSSARTGIDGGAAPSLQVEGSTLAGASITVTRNSNDTSPPVIYLSKSRSTSYSVVSSGDNLGVIGFTGADGSITVSAATIKAEVDGTPGTNDMPGRLVFSTTADGASSPTERMRIASTGRITIEANSTTGGIYVNNWSTGAGNSTVKYSSTTGQLTYDTSSRLVKTDIEDCPYGLEQIKLLRPRQYFRVDDQRNEIGFVADEVASVMPEFVPVGPKSIITKNEDDTEEIPLAVNYDKITAVLTKALQQALTKIETLEAKVAALEAS